MRIVMIAYEFPPRILGGLGVHCDYLVKSLLDKKVEVVFITPATKKAPLKEKRGELTIYRIQGSREKFPKDYNAFPTFYYQDYVKDFNENVFEKFEEIENETGKIDVIHSQDWGAIESGIAIKNKFKKPLVITLHGIEVLKYPHKSDQRSNVIKIEKKSKKADRIITVSNFVKKEIQKKYNFPLRKFVAVYNGVDTKKYSPDRITKELIERMRKKFHFVGKKNILYIGRLDYNKGIPTLIKAIKICKDEGYKIKLVIVGVGKEGFTNKLKKIRNNLRLEKEIKFLGWTDELTKDTLYVMADIVVIPSTYEGFGFTATEAMSMGAPLIVSDIPTFKELIDKKTALFFRLNNHKDLAKKIIFLLNNRKLAVNMGKKARKFIKKNYSWKKVAENTINVYKRVIR